MRILSAITLLAVLVVASAEIIPFGEKAVNAIFKEKRDAIILFTDAGSVESKNVFEDAANADASGLVYTSLNKEANADHFKRFAEYLGLDVSALPRLVFLQEGKKKFLAESGDVSVESITAFVSGVKAGEVKAFLKSAPIPEDNTHPVKVLVGKNFRDVVYGDDKEYLVKFYAPWCGHCKKIAPEYDAAAAAISHNPNIVLAKFDGTLNEVEGIEISGYPTLYYFGKDKTAEPIKFSGGRDKEGILLWLKDHTEHEWLQPVETPQIEEEL